MNTTPSPWAVKKTHSRTRAAGDNDVVSARLRKEALILKELNHPNIIGYRGFRRTADGASILAVENGERSLMDIIEEIREDDLETDSVEPLPAKVILSVVKRLAAALDYLHTEKRLLHGDIKSANVLIVGDFEQVKLCDFGVALRLDDKEDRLADDEDGCYVGTGPWSALETLDDDSESQKKIGSKSDIFSLGCVMYEMLAMETPHLGTLSSAGDDDDDSSIDESAYEELLGTRPELPEDLKFDAKEYSKVLAIFYACTEGDPRTRPSARDLHQLIDTDPHAEGGRCADVNA